MSGRDHKHQEHSSATFDSQGKRSASTKSLFRPRRPRLDCACARWAFLTYGVRLLASRTFLLAGSGERAAITLNQSRGLSLLPQGKMLVAHAQKVELISKSKRKDDRHDARTLARLARIDPELSGPVRHRSAQAQIHLTVIRARAELVSVRTAPVNAARGGASCQGTMSWGASRRVSIQRLQEPPSLSPGRGNSNSRGSQ
jgi:hypothetical protein